MNLIGWGSIDLSDKSGKVGSNRADDHAITLQGTHFFTLESFLLTEN